MEDMIEGINQAAIDYWTGRGLDRGLVTETMKSVAAGTVTSVDAEIFLRGKLKEQTNRENDITSTFTYTDFDNLSVFRFISEIPNELDRGMATQRLARRAKEVGFGDFKSLLRKYLRENARSGSRSRGDSDSPFADLIGRPDKPNVIAGVLIDNYNVVEINDAVHYYDSESGIYRSGEKGIHRLLLTIDPTLSHRERHEIFLCLSVHPDLPRREVSPPTLIPLRSNIYDIEHDKYIAYGPQHVFLNRFNIDYVKDAKPCIIIDKTLATIANGNSEILELIYESIGNIFLLQNRYRGAMFWYGSGANGKSTVLNLIVQMIGIENIAFMSIQDMNERFRRAELYQKAAVFCDDMSSDYVPDTSTFKSVVTGGTVMAERKGEAPFLFVPYSKVIFCMNELPKTGDKSRGYYSRVLPVPLMHDFTKDGDASLKDRKWSEDELTYLAKLSIEALKRLMERGDFIKPQIVTDELQRYERENDPLLEFVHEHGDVVDSPCTILYQQYSGWCNDSGHKPVTRTRFSRELCKRYKLTTKPKYVPQYGPGMIRCFAPEE